MGSWIKTIDQMPEPDVQVLTWNGCDFGIDYCDIEVDFGTVFFANDPDNTITHWKVPKVPEQ